MWFGANILTTRSLAASNSAKRFGEVLKGVWSESRVNQRTYHEMLKCKEVLGVPFACGTQVFFTHCPLFVFLLLLSAFMFCTFVTFSLVHRFHYGLLHCLNSLCYIVLRLVSTSHSLFEGVCHMYLLHLFFFLFSICVTIFLSESGCFYHCSVFAALRERFNRDDVHDKLRNYCKLKEIMLLLWIWEVWLVWSSEMCGLLLCPYLKLYYQFFFKCNLSCDFFLYLCLYWDESEQMSCTTFINTLCYYTQFFYTVP